MTGDEGIGHGHCSCEKYLKFYWDRKGVGDYYTVSLRGVNKTMRMLGSRS